MCSRPSRSLKSTVTALMRFSSVRYLSRSSWTLCRATRFLRCSFAFRFSCSNSSYERARKLRSSFDMNLLKCDYRSDIKWGCDGWFAIVRIARRPESVSLKNLISHIDGIYLRKSLFSKRCRELVQQALVIAAKSLRGYRVAPEGILAMKKLIFL